MFYTAIRKSFFTEIAKSRYLRKFYSAKLSRYTVVLTYLQYTSTVYRDSNVSCVTHGCDRGTSTLVYACQEPSVIQPSCTFSTANHLFRYIVYYKCINDTIDMIHTSKCQNIHAPSSCLLHSILLHDTPTTQHSGTRYTHYTP